MRICPLDIMDICTKCHDSPRIVAETFTSETTEYPPNDRHESSRCSHDHEKMENGKSSLSMSSLALHVPASTVVIVFQPQLNYL